MVEVSVAIGIAAVCLVSILSLLPVGLKVNRTASDEAAACRILSMMAADFLATCIQAPSSSGPPEPATLYLTQDGQTAPAAGLARYRMTVTFLVNPAGANAATWASVKISWPAVAEPSRAEGSVVSFVALNRN